MTIRNVTKNLVGMEDLLTGVGKTDQVRKEVTYSMGRMDVPYAVQSTVELQALDVTRFINARIYSSTTDFVDYRYDPGDVTGITPITGSGSWIRTDGINTIVYLNTLDGVDVTGTTDSTSAIQAALDKGGIIYGRAGDTYLFSTLKVKPGVTEFNSNGATFLPSGDTNPVNLTTEAAVVLQGAQTGGIAVNNAKISLKIDMQNGDRTAILGDGCQDCEFIGCDIYGFTNNATYNHRGIRLQDDGIRGANRNKVHHNSIEGFNTPTQLGLLIEVWGTPGANFAGYFTGTVVDASLASIDNLIYSNTLLFGNYAVNIQAAESNTFFGNTCRGQKNRSIYVANGSKKNIIMANQCLSYGSSAIVLGYGARDNIFANNECTTNIIAGEAAVNVNTGSTGNLIVNNDINSATNYGVYNGTDSSDTQITGNHIKNFYLAGVQVENDIIDTSPTNAVYIRPNYADPDTVEPTATSWTFNDTDGVVVEGNTFYYGYTGRNTAAISIAQIQNDLVGANSTDLTNTTIKNNTVVSMSNIAYCLYIYEQNSGRNTGVRLASNTANPAASSADFVWFNTSGQGDIKTSAVFVEGNEVLDDVVHGDPVMFTDADTTPNVSLWRFFNFANTGATSVTDFDGAIEGKEIVLRGDVNTTIVYTSGLIRPKGLTDVVGMSANSLISFKSIGGIWYEMWRNF